MDLTTLLKSLSSEQDVDNLLGALQGMKKSFGNNVATVANVAKGAAKAAAEPVVDGAMSFADAVENSLKAAANAPANALAVAQQAAYDFGKDKVAPAIETVRQTANTVANAPSSLLAMGQKAAYDFGYQATQPLRNVRDTLAGATAANVATDAATAGAAGLGKALQGDMQADTTAEIQKDPEASFFQAVENSLGQAASPQGAAAAPQAPVAAPEQFLKDFQVTHGGPFDPNSQLDRTKMAQLQAARAKHPDVSPTQLALMIYRNQI